MYIKNLLSFTFVIIQGLLLSVMILVFYHFVTNLNKINAEESHGFHVCWYFYDNCGSVMSYTIAIKAPHKVAGNCPWMVTSAYMCSVAVFRLEVRKIQWFIMYNVQLVDKWLLVRLAEY